MDASGEAARIVARTAPATVSAPAAQGHLIVRYGGGVHMLGGPSSAAHPGEPFVVRVPIRASWRRRRPRGRPLRTGRRRSITTKNGPAGRPPGDNHAGTDLLAPSPAGILDRYSTVLMDSRFDGNDITPARAVTPSQAGIHRREHCGRRMSRRQGEQLPGLLSFLPAAAGAGPECIGCPSDLWHPWGVRARCPRLQSHPATGNGRPRESGIHPMHRAGCPTESVSGIIAKPGRHSDPAPFR